MKSFRRADRVSSLIREIVAELIVREAKDPRVKQALVTDVSIGDDLRVATVFYRIGQSSFTRKEVQQSLDKARGFFRKRLGDSLEMKFTPEVRFLYDERIDQAERIESIIRELHKTKQEK